MIYVLDAHTLVWFVTDDARLSPTAAAAIADPSARLIVPTIVLAEIHHLHGRNRVAASLKQVRSFVTATTNAVIRPFDVAVLDRLPSGLEIHDGIIVATARVYRDGGPERVRLITRDKQIAASGLIDVLW